MLFPSYKWDGKNQRSSLGDGGISLIQISMGSQFMKQELEAHNLGFEFWLYYLAL